MPNCPICKTQDIKLEETACCDKCKFPLAAYDLLKTAIKEDVSPKLNSIIDWAEKLWTSSQNPEKESSQSTFLLDLKTREQSFSHDPEKLSEDRLDFLSKQIKQNAYQIQELNNLSEKVLQLEEKIKEAEKENKSQQSNIDNKIEQKILPIKDDLSKLESKLDTRLESLEQGKSEVKSQIEVIQKTIEEIKISHANREIISSQIISSETISNSQQISPQEHDFSEKYNQNANIFEETAIKVNTTEGTMNQARLGTGQKITLEETRRGSYWIIFEKSSTYLVPKANLKINAHSYSNVQNLFQCDDYDETLSQDFKLKKAAKVSSIPGEEKWQLEDPGILQFYTIN